MEQERTLIIVKPNAVQKRVAGQIIQAFEARRELSFVQMKLTKLSENLCKIFYEEHKEKPFFAELTQFMSSGAVIAAVLQGGGAVSSVREMLGHTDPSKADAGSLRAEFGDSLTQNSLHGSDSKESAEREIALIFPSLKKTSGSPDSF